MRLNRVLLPWVVLFAMLAFAPAANAQLTNLYNSMSGPQTVQGVNNVAVGPSFLGTFKAATSFRPTATGEASLLSMMGQCVIPYPTGTTCRGIGEVSIQNDVGGKPSGVTLGTMGFYLTDTLSGQPVRQRCGTLSPRVRLVAGTKYWAVMTAPDQIGWSNWTDSRSEVLQSIDDGAWTASPNQKLLALRIDSGFDECIPVAKTQPDPGTEVGDMYVRTGGTAYSTMTLSNAGVAPLTFSSADFSGPDASAFTLTSQAGGPALRYPQQVGVDGLLLMQVNCKGGAQERWQIATLTLHTNAPNGKDIAFPVKCLVDNTPPTVTLTAPAKDGNNGWYVHPFTLKSSAIDPEPSSLVAQTLCSIDGSLSWFGYGGLLDLGIDNEGSHTIVCDATDRAGNRGSASFAYKLDSRAPVVTPVYTPARTSDGWNNTATTLSFTCADPTPGSGVNTQATGGGTVSTETAGRDFTSSGCTDVAGNAATALTATVRIDMTKPVLSATLTPAANAAGWNNSDVTVGFDCADAGAVKSGIRTDSVPDIKVTAETSETLQLSTGTCDDKAGNTASLVSQVVRVDKTPPSAQITSAAPPAAVNTTSATFAFAGSDDRSGVARLECRLDADAWTACTSSKQLTGLADGAHTFGVRAVDVAGNTQTAPATQTWTVDTVAPQTSLVTGPNAPTTSKQALFTYSGDAGGGTAIAGYQCRLDGGAWEQCPTGIVGKSYTGLADGSHTFEVRAIDAAGNADATPASRTWTVDTVAPDTQIDSAPKTFTSSRAAAFTFSGDPGAGSAIASYECRLDGGAWGACASYSGLADGLHNFEVRAVDAAGNRDGSPAAHMWTVDTVAPDTKVDSGPSGFTASRSAAFTYSGDALGGTAVTGYECRLDGGSWEACRDYADLAGGDHSFQVRAIDAAGNVDDTPATRAWTIDLAGPQTSIDSHPDAVTKDRGASFTYSADALGGSAVAGYECRLDGGAWGACTSYTDLGGGAHTFEVRAIDGVGNADDTPAAYDWRIDLLAPATQITGKPEAKTLARTATFAFAADDAGGSTVAGFECRLDDGAWAPCTSGVQYSDLTLGSHTFDVRAADALGNVEDPAVSYDWVISALLANDDEATTAEDTPVVIDVVDNDVKPGAVTVTTGAQSQAGGSVAPSGTGAVRYDPPADYDGTDEFTYTVDSGDESSSATVTVDVTPVNDPPTFQAGSAEIAVDEDSGAYDAPWASAIDAHEPGQQAHFTVQTSDPGLFSSQPAVSPQGRLTFTPAPDAKGSATADVRLVDDGGGKDTSAPVRLTITIKPVAGAPAAPAAPQAVKAPTAPTVTVTRDMSCSGVNTTLRLSVHGIEGDGSSLKLSGSSSSKRVGLAYGGSGTERTVSISRRPGLRRATVVVRLVDGAYRYTTRVRLAVGTKGRDRLRGGAGADLLFGLGGRDVIDGRGGPDLICGGPGRDKLRGGPGADVFGAGRGDLLADFSAAQGDRRR